MYDSEKISTFSCSKPMVFVELFLQRSKVPVRKAKQRSVLFVKTEQTSILCCKREEVIDWAKKKVAELEKRIGQEEGACA